MKIGDIVELKRSDKKRGVIEIITNHWNGKKDWYLLGIRTQKGGFIIKSNKSVKLCKK